MKTIPKKEEIISLLSTGNYALAFDSVLGNFSLKKLKEDKESIDRSFYKKINYSVGLEIEKDLKLVECCKGTFSTIKYYKIEE